MIIKNLTTIIFLLIGTLVSGQSTKQATARIFESQNKAFSEIVVVYEDGESELIPLKNWKVFGSSGTNNEILIDNQKVINTFLNDMTSKGYEISKMTSSGESLFYTFFVFNRKVE